MARDLITEMASICKVGPYSDGQGIPKGASLINYIYNELLSLVNKEMIVVLNSILYTCCQVFFM